MRLVDIARDLNISYTAVSVTLNGKADRYGISKATQARILAYAEKVGYVKDLDASHIANSRTNQVGILLPSNPNHLSESQRTLYFLLLQMLHKAGIVPIIQAVDPQTFLQGVRNLLGCKVNDVIAVGNQVITLCLNVHPFATLMRNRRLYLVDFVFGVQRVNEKVFKHCYRIGFDRHSALHEVLGHLRDAGHRVIAIPEYLRTRQFGELTGEEQTVTLLPIYETAASPQSTSYQEGSRLLPQVITLMQDHDCTAVMMSGDAKAIGLIYALTNAGIRVPEDISLVGFEGIVSAEYACVPLTTVEIPTQQIIKVVQRLLVSSRDESDKPAQMEYILPCTFVKRKSLGTVLKVARRGWQKEVSQPA